MPLNCQNDLSSISTQQQNDFESVGLERRTPLLVIDLCVSLSFKKVTVVGYEGTMHRSWRVLPIMIAKQIEPLSLSIITLMIIENRAL